MPRKILATLCLALFALALGGGAAAGQGREVVYVIRLADEVDRALPLWLERGFAAAAAAGARAIILEIDTFGGAVVAAKDIKNLILDTPVPVYAHVRTAISAGAYIALACDAIYMHQGSTLGAVEPVVAGAPDVQVDEKTLSVIENEMRTMAERLGRDPDIASAMVRREVAIPGLIPGNQLLTLTAQKALEVGYAEGVVSSRNDILAERGLANAELVFYRMSWADRLARVLTRFEVSALLLAIAMFALWIELFSPGIGIPGAVSVIAFALFFGGHMFVGFAEWEYLAVFMVGIILLFAEIFVAGFGILGAAGLLFIAFSIVLVGQDMTEGLKLLGLALVIAVALMAVSFRFLKKSNIFTRLVLSDAESKERGYVGPRDLSQYIGQTGKAITPLRPSGTIVLAEGMRLDAITEGNYIAAGTEVVVVGFSSGDAVVTPK